MEHLMQPLAYLTALVTLIGYLFYIKRQQGFIIPKNRAKNKDTGFIDFSRKRPDFSAYPIHQFMEWIVKGLAVILALVIIWLLFFAEIPK